MLIFLNKIVPFSECLDRFLDAHANSDKNNDSPRVNLLAMMFMSHTPPEFFFLLCPFYKDLRDL